MSWTFWPLIDQLLLFHRESYVISFLKFFKLLFDLTSSDDALLFIRNRHNYFFYFVLWDDTDSDTLIEKISSQVIIYCLSNKLWLMNIRGSSFIIHICRRFVLLSNVCVYQYRIFIKKWECPNIIKTIIIYS